jgi:hypothetical protein
MSKDGRTGRRVIALVLAATMTSPACSGGCRSKPPSSQAADPDASRGGGTPVAATAPAAVTAAGAAAPALDAAATAEALSYIEQVAKQSAAAPDVPAQAAALGRDAAKVFAYVRGGIRYQVYDGVLRGAAGALSGRAANAWDTALLAAELLKRGGFEVRFARGTLPDDKASALVDRMFAQTMTPGSQALSAGSVQPPSAAAAAADASRRRIEANWRTNTAEVMAALKRAGIALGTAPPVSDATLLAQARDHVWVEYKEGLQWIPLDPVAATKVGDAAAPAREIFDAVPESKQHLVTITLNVEQRASGTVETRAALTLRAPAADLHGQPIILAHEVTVTGSGAWKAMPVLLVGDKAVGGTAYGPGGVQTADNSGAGGIGNRLDRMFGGAPSSTADSTAAWLDVTMTSPDGRSETARHEVFDRIGPVARGSHAESTAALQPLAIADNRPRALTAVVACAVTAGPLNAAALTSRVATAAPILRDEALRAQLAKGDTTGIPDDRLKQIGLAASAALAVLPQSAHLLSQEYASEAAPALGQSILFYEASPRVAIATFHGTGDADPKVSLDLRRNGLCAVGRSVPPGAVIAANVARGVLDGAIEDALIAGDGLAVSTASVLAEARVMGIAIAASAPQSVQAAGWPDDARARIHADQAPSVVVVAPASPVAIGGGTRTAWWRIDTATGEIVGVVDSGLNGAQMMDEALLLGLILTGSQPVTKKLGAGVVRKVANAAIMILQNVAAGAANGAQRGWKNARQSW